MKRLVLIMFMLVIAMTTVMFMTACGGDSETSGAGSEPHRCDESCK